jgi:hypothetical protein
MSTAKGQMTATIHPGKADETMAFIRINQSIEDEDTGIVDNRTGFIQCNAEKADALLTRVSTGEIKVSFGNKLTNGNYEINVTKKAATIGAATKTLAITQEETELEHQ